ncbi:MAG: hypothetical protein ACFFED_12495, partial [Candidatus Thorarchaeota archaeon]
MREQTLTESRNSVLSYVSGAGDEQDVSIYASRVIDGLDLNVQNSYSSTSQHLGEIDLSSYLLSGWCLYKADVEPSLITAVPERESTGITPNSYMQIRNSSGLTVDALYQEFYNQPHDGRLENYTLIYIAPYLPSGAGQTYLVVRSDFTDPSTNQTSYSTPFTQTIFDTTTTHDCSSDNSILSESTPYYVVIDGTGLINYGGFPQLYWRSSSSVLGDDTGYRLRDDSTWYPYVGAERQEAFLQYAYTPWNQTSNSALVYSIPESVSLTANSSSLTGDSWTFSDSSNITSISFQSNQSVQIDYSITLWYKQDMKGSAQWEVQNSGNMVNWNLTATPEYPKSSDMRYLNFTIPSTWKPTGMYNSSMPSSNHSYYLVSQNIVAASFVNNDTWTLVSTSFNHLSDISSYDSSDDSPITYEVNSEVILEINLTLSEESSSPVLSGTTNLTVWKDSTIIFAPANESVSSGGTSYSWNIPSTISENGIYRIEAFWTNGSSSGYLTQELAVFHSTTFTATSYAINAYTESSFAIRVDYEEIFTPKGINGSLGTVQYSFDGASNATMSDLTNGTWTASISTTGKAPGDYIVDVYAEGFALENQSLEIHVSLIHETLPLDIWWSNSDNITYVEYTELSVLYQRTSGENVSDAQLNVTIDTTTWKLRWDPVDETYKMRFNGTDSDPGFGTHSITIQAWKVGYQNQYDDSESITIRKESTTINIQWTSGNGISYVESTTLSISYLMSNGTSIVDAIANVTINGYTYDLVYDSDSKTYNCTFIGSSPQLSFGVHLVEIAISKYGYESQYDSSQILTVSEEDTSLTVQWGNTNSITYVQYTTLIVNYTMSNGTAIEGATLNFTIDTTTLSLDWESGSKTYRYQFNGDDLFPGFGTHGITILADKFGYVDRMNNTETLSIDLEGTSIVVVIEPDNDVTFTEYSTIICDYLMSNDSAILGAIINVTLGTSTWNLTWSPANEDYRIRINGSDVPPGLGIFTVNINADRYGYESQADSSKTITIREEPTILSFQWSNGNNISYVEYTILQVNYSLTSGGTIDTAEVNVTIGLTTWDLSYNFGTGYYEIQFNGTDAPPDFGTHSIIVKADLLGYESRENNTENLILREEFTSLAFEWISTNTISYVGYTILNVSYTMSNGSAIVDANLNATINGDTWLLVWNQSTSTYVITFNGTDNPPSFGTHSITIKAGKYGYIDRTDGSTLTINPEDTTLTIVLLPDNDITYTDYSTIVATYLMSNGTAIIGAEVNVTINSNVWNLWWDSDNQNYRLRLNGSDSPPGFGTFNVLVKAGKYGYIHQTNNTYDVTLRIEPTLFSVQWTNTNSPSYLDSTTLLVGYTKSDLTPIANAEVNVTIDSMTWLLIWNSTSGYFEITFNGSDVPPGVGTHSLSVSCGVFGYEEQVDTTQTLTLPVIPTLFDISWTNGDSISYVESTKLIVNYTMFNGTVIEQATVNVTFGVTTWTLQWNGVSKIYEVVFNGYDDPPGIDSYSLDIRASKVDFQSWVDDTETLTVSKEDTSYTINWSATDNITYVQHTTLIIDYLMSNGTEIPNAVVNATISGTTWILRWDASNLDYRLIFNGTDTPPGLGTHSMIIKAEKFGYVSFTNSAQELTLRQEEIIYSLNWNIVFGNNISYLESTTLVLVYQMSNGTPIVDAIVNVTIDTTTLSMFWNSTSESYEIQFNGSDSFPGFGTFPLTIKSSKFGYISVIDATQELTIRVEDADLTIGWDADSSISYLETTTLQIGYYLRNGTSILEATINVTIDSTTWSLIWNPSTEYYEISFNGTDALPGLGIHNILISAWKANYQTQVNSTEVLSITVEGTAMTIDWIPGNSITYVESTILSVNYTLTNGSAVLSAKLNVTIGTGTWTLQWDEDSDTYRIQFNGTDVPPGLGTHGLTIRAWRFGYQSHVDSTENLVITGELGQIESQWIGGGTITFVESTILSANYTMSNGTAIPLAIVNVTIDTTTWNLIWDDASETYRIQFNGSDNQPGLGVHSLTIKAWRDGFDYVQDTSMVLSITNEGTSLSASWITPYLNNISYFQFTAIQVTYQMSNGSNIPFATVNVTIGFTTWNLLWNGTSERFELIINGTDTPPGFGEHALFIQADAYGYQSQSDSDETLIVRKDPSSLEVTWPQGNTITYIEQTKIVVFYRMSNGTSISDGSLNITIAGFTFDLNWNQTSGGYELVLNGTDNPPGLGSFLPVVKASGPVYTNVEISTVFAIINEGTSVSIWWQRAGTDSNSTFYYTQTEVLRVYYRDSMGTFIPGASQKTVTVNGTIYSMNEASGYYWIQLGYETGLGYHVVTVNVSKVGYDYAFKDGFHYNITEVPTSLFVTWDSVEIDYLGQANLTAQYWDDNAFRDVSKTIVTANITIDGWYTIGLNTSGNYWIANLSGVMLDLGPHAILIRTWVYGYEYQENTTIVTVAVVSTAISSLTWEPSNVTIEYTDLLNLTVDYLSSYGDVPDTATVNVTINSIVYNLTYSLGSWKISILGRQIGIGVYEAYISAWQYGFGVFTNTT